MTPAQIALARRLVALRGWRWPEKGSLHVVTIEDVMRTHPGLLDLSWPTLLRPDLPDISSPLVVGWVLFLVEAAYGFASIITDVTIWGDGRAAHGIVGVDGGGGHHVIVPCYAEGDEVERLSWSRIEALVNALAALEEA